MKRLGSAALTMLGQISLNQGRYSEAIRIYSRAIETAGESYLPGMWGKFAGRGAAFLRMGSLQEARKDFERGLEIARQVESRYGDVLMRVYLALNSLAGGGAPLASLPQLEAEAAALDLHAVVLLTSLARAGLWRLLGQVDPALAACRRAVQAAQASGVPQFLQNAQLETLLTQSLGDELPDRAALEALWQTAQTAGEVPQQARAALTLAVLLKRQGQPAEALSACQGALTLARSCPDQPLLGESLLLAMCLHEALGQPGQAQTCRAELLTLAQTAYAPLALALEADGALRQVVLTALG